ncbi:MAG: hypothetical protein HQL28_01775 [Candidatus Omnitrophica bacterium]|nr:hypothetical protein [Candidatus Omnitrophota bacterium]
MIKKCSFPASIFRVFVLCCLLVSLSFLNAFGESVLCGSYAAVSLDSKGIYDVKEAYNETMVFDGSWVDTNTVDYVINDSIAEDSASSEENTSGLPMLNTDDLVREMDAIKEVQSCV